MGISHLITAHSDNHLPFAPLEGAVLIATPHVLKVNPVSASRLLSEAYTMDK